MLVLLFSDLHDSSRGLWALTDFLSKNKDIGGLVFAGDVTNMGEPLSFAEKFVIEISKFNLPLLWVPGNNDFGRSYKILQNFTPSLEGRIVELGGRRFTGIGGSPASWSSEYQGENSLPKEEIKGTIFVSHYLPPGIKYGDQSTNQPINQSNFSDAPLAHICGHIHNTQGIGYIGQTKVIKLASSALGNVAIMNLDNLEIKFMKLL